MAKKECQHPDKLKGKPGECSPERIKECYGDAKEHSCVNNNYCLQGCLHPWFL